MERDFLTIRARSGRVRLRVRLRGFGVELLLLVRELDHQRVERQLRHAVPEPTLPEGLPNDDAALSFPNPATAFVAVLRAILVSSARSVSEPVHTMERQGAVMVMQMRTDGSWVVRLKSRPTWYEPYASMGTALRAS